MTWIDWSVVAIFFLISIALGTVFTKRAGQSLESYFVSNRQLGWWLAGSSMAATAFSSDTPLLLTGMIRRRGVWGVWEVLALSISTMLAVFVFAKLWKRANVMTEVELVERRYSGGAAAWLRGFKTIYWGLLYNCYVLGAWPVTGLRKVLEEMTGAGRETAIIVSVILATLYTSSSGLWGVALTDLFQFIWAMVGAIILAWAAVNAVGGMTSLRESLEGTSALAIIPPMASGGEGSWVSSPFGWFAGLLLVQWWAWKNTDGGGILVQRLVSCKDERQAMWSVLWFNIAHYCLRSWPWILTALASLLLVPNAHLAVDGFIDHERAYPRLITLLLPVGLKGVMLASFFAAFLSTASTHLNWGASYLVNDVYKRFIRRNADTRHYLFVSRLMPWGLAVGAVWVAWSIHSVGEAFTLILNLTAGIGPVYLLRWLWWRVNPWSEIAAMCVSLPMLWMRPHVLAWLGIPQGLVTELLFMVIGSACCWLPATLLTRPVDRQTLTAFYEAVRPPGWWKPIAAMGSGEPWGLSVVQWVLGTIAILTTTLSPLAIVLGQAPAGWVGCGVAALSWLGLVRTITTTTWRWRGQLRRAAPSESSQTAN
ncbi:MAG: Na+:solute symporter [Candidatus Omnitrophica bacterium]|nr:Na+:solute symporter [Candidatus Omnitrophota bacterium]